jgi:hypothetical protein
VEDLGLITPAPESEGVWHWPAVVSVDIKLSWFLATISPFADTGASTFLNAIHCTLRDMPSLAAHGVRPNAGDRQATISKLEGSGPAQRAIHQ